MGIKIVLNIRYCFHILCYWFYAILNLQYLLSYTDCSDCDGFISECISGKCISENENNIDNSTSFFDLNKTPKYFCQCYDNWSGRNCDIFSCSGRLRLLDNYGTLIEATGNYTTDNKCTWLVGDGDATYPMRLQVQEFATECGWDNLYIYDGSSIEAPLVAVLSGILPHEDLKFFPEITLSSGFAYFHFYSDAAYNMSGFVINYWRSACPSNCSNNGHCLNNRTCSCNSGWTGVDCKSQVCPENCSNNGICLDTGCQCYSSYRGEDCSVPENTGYWEKVNTLGEYQPNPSASQSLLLVGELLYVVGGYTYRSNDFVQVSKFNFKTKFWKQIITSNSPQARYGHSINQYKNQILMVAGVTSSDILNDLYLLSLEDLVWKEMISLDQSSMLATSGHTSHIINNVLYVLFGHNPVYGFLNTVQIFDLKTYSWSILKTTGASIKGTYGHTSLYDSDTNSILVHGGYASDSVTAYYMSDSLYALNIETNSWKVLSSSGHNRYLHSASIIGRFMFVFGGNTHNDTLMSQGAKCYSNNFLAYDIDCNQWYVLDSPKSRFSASRYGHSSVAHGDDMYIYGGYNGILHNDLLKYSIGRCKGTNMTDCISPKRGTRCMFVDDQNCFDPNETKEKLQYKNIQDFKQYTCEKAARTCDKNTLKTCTACVVNSDACIWCGDSCRSNSTACERFADSEEKCWSAFESKSANCIHLHNCQVCNIDDACIWNSRESRCDFVVSKEAVNRTCEQPACNWHTSCENCTRNSCMWCSNMGRCVESNSYVASFPYGLCMEWTTNNMKCPATRCDDHRTCLSCLYNPACGFCDDGSDTGLGQCMPGDYSWSDNLQCNREHWIFATCPLCQCNGHSQCFENTSTCLACSDNTQGDRCENCKNGFWGNPAVGGNCSSCQCFDNEDSCNQRSGQCICRTRGAIGVHCQECDKDHAYILNLNNVGACYYKLIINNIITFNLSRDGDRFLTKMNFYNIPPARDKDVDFNVNCTSTANISVVIRQGNQDEVVLPNSACNLYSYRFSSKDYVFGDHSNTTFFVFISNMHIPIVIHLSFSQSDNLDLLKFFITFFSCFFSLLLIAFIAWKIKQRYDLYRRSRRHMQEMAEMARRPFSTCYVVVEDSLDEDHFQLDLNSDVKHSLKKRKCKASAIAIEPLSGSKVAVLTLLLRLPHADDAHSLPEQSGFVLGSTLISYGGHTRRSIGETVPKVPRNTKVNIDENNILSIQAV